MKEFDKYFNISVLHKAPDDPRVCDRGDNIVEIRHYEDTPKQIEDILSSLDCVVNKEGKTFGELISWYGDNYLDIVRINNGLPDKDRYEEKAFIPLGDKATVCVRGNWTDKDRFIASSFIQLKRDDKSEVLQLEVEKKFSLFFVVNYFKNDKACYRALPEFGGLNNLSISSIEAIRDDLKLIEDNKKAIIQEVVQHQHMINSYLSPFRGL